MYVCSNNMSIQFYVDMPTDMPHNYSTCTCSQYVDATTIGGTSKVKVDMPSVHALNNMAKLLCPPCRNIRYASNEAAWIFIRACSVVILPKL